MNRLYGLIMGEAGAPSGYYAKLYSAQLHSDRSRRLRDGLAGKAESKGRLPVFACLVCDVVRNTRFWKEILELDPENTYCGFARDPLASPESGYDCAWDLVPSAADMRGMDGMLDRDIRDRLSVPTWPEHAAAVCLQMLRDAL